MIKTTLQFTDEQIAAFKRIAKEQGRPFSQAVRGALDEWLIAKEKGKSLENSINKTDEIGVTVWMAGDQYTSGEEVHYLNAVGEDDEDERLRIYNPTTRKTIARFDRDLIRGWANWS